MMDINDDELDKILKKKYKEIEVPDKFFDKRKLLERISQDRRDKQRILKVASIIIILVVIGASFFSIKLLNKNYDNLNENIEITGNEENKIEEKIVVGNIFFDISSNIYDNPKINYVTIIEVKEILDYEIIDGVPSTRVKAKVVKNYLNDLEGDVEMIIPGGKFEVKEVKNLLGIDDEITKYKDNQYVNLTCKNDVYIADVEPNKHYLTTTYEKDGLLFICSGLKYGFKEYNEETNTIKDSDGNSINVDMENYLKEK